MSSSTSARAGAAAPRSPTSTAPNAVLLMSLLSGPGGDLEVDGGALLERRGAAALLVAGRLDARGLALGGGERVRRADRERVLVEVLEDAVAVAAVDREHADRVAARRDGAGEDVEGLRL